MHDHLPKVLREIAQIAGVEAAWELAHGCGGQTVYIPAYAKEDHWLSELVGFDAAKRICEYYRTGEKGGELLVPMAKFSANKQRMIRALERGLSPRRAAAESGLHERTAWRTRRKMKRENKNQGRLF